MSKIDPASTSSNTPKDSPVAVETFADVLKLLQVDHLDVDPWVQDLAVETTNRILAEDGPEWFEVKQNRIRSIASLEYINEQ